MPQVSLLRPGFQMPMPPHAHPGEQASIVQAMNCSSTTPLVGFESTPPPTPLPQPPACYHPLAGVRTTTCLNLPFGDALTCNGSANPAGYHFTGNEHDAETGLDYFGARYYASTMGRFMSPDWSAKVAPVPYAKLRDPQTLNLYAYVGNNPLFRTDPTGHYVCSGSKANCNLVKDAIANIKEAANSGNLTKKEAAALNKVLGFYGQAGKDNGVTVGFQKTGVSAGGTSTENGRTTITLSLRSTLANPNSRQNGASPDTEAAAQAAHEGEHGVQQQNHGMPMNRGQEMAGEVDAYSVQSYVNKGEQDKSSYWSNPAGGAIWSMQGGFNAGAVNDYAKQSTDIWCQAGGNCK